MPRSARELRVRYVVCQRRVDCARTIGWAALEESWQADLAATVEAMRRMGVKPPRTSRRK
jgi:hypothetical protein